MGKKMGNIESVDGQSEMKHHIMPLKVPMPDATELEEKFAIVLVSCNYPRRVMAHFICHIAAITSHLPGFGFVYLFISPQLTPSAKVSQ